MSDFVDKPVVFLAFANPRDDTVGGNLRHLPDEARRLREVLEPAERDGLCEVVVRYNCTADDIFKVFQNSKYRNRIAAFHYGGHANGYQLLLESAAGQAVAADAGGLARFLGQQKGLQLVFLNGCSTKQQTRGLLGENIPAVISTSQRIDDKVARNFAHIFYQGLAGEASLGEAYNEAESALETTCGGDKRALYFGDPDASQQASDRWPWALHLHPGSENADQWSLREVDQGSEASGEWVAIQLATKMYAVTEQTLRNSIDRGEIRVQDAHPGATETLLLKTENLDDKFFPRALLPFILTGAVGGIAVSVVSTFMSSLREQLGALDTENASRLIERFDEESVGETARQQLLRASKSDLDRGKGRKPLSSKGLVARPDAGSATSARRIARRERQIAELLSSYQAAVQREWQNHWSDDTAGNEPPFIDTQGLRLLLETERPQQYLHPQYFRVGRGARSTMAAQDLGDWAAVDRAELAANQMIGQDESPLDLSRLVITTDAGVGKTTTMQWLEAELNRPGAATVAFYLTFSRIPAHVDEFLPALARRMLQKRRDEDGNGASLTEEDAVRLLESLRDNGRLVLLLDALDQEPADGSAPTLVAELLGDSSWDGCRIVISGRPHALQRHWPTLFASELRRGWRFVQVDEFTPEEQERFLGSDKRGGNRLQMIPQEAHEILSTPRVLSYLRNLPDVDLKKIRTAGDVYWHSVEHLLVAGMQGSEAARRIGLDSHEPAPDKVQARSKLRSLEVLAAIAFEMTSTLTPRGDRPQDETSATPNFDGVPRNLFSRFRKRLQSRLSAHASLDRDLDGLAALNEFITQGFFDTTVDGLQEVYWRNRSLQEFFTALWLSQYCTADDVQQLWDWLYLPDRPETEEYYWVWRFLCEMHANGRDPESWLRAVEPIYRPGDGTVAGTRRSSEFMYRAWKPLTTLAGQAEPAAIEVRDRFVGEFSDQILSGTRGEQARHVAHQFCDSFIDIPAGDFQIGAPPEKQGMGEELRERWKTYLEQDGDPKERARQHIAEWNFTPGKRGEQEREDVLEWFTEVFQTRDLDRVEKQFYPKDEKPAEPMQTVAAFRLCRSPVLNGWYRLFSPGHGESESSYHEKYQAASSAPDCPVIFVSWYDAWAFTQWARWDTSECRLPREYEWEYAAKAGTAWDQNYWWGDELDETKCNADQNVGRTTPPTAEHANPWGLEDMLGNVWEWCEDWYRAVYDRNNRDEATYRVYRGGSWRVVARRCRAAYRSRLDPAHRGGNLGFRVVAVPRGGAGKKNKNQE